MHVLKNIVVAVLVLAGLVMRMLPGQGLIMLAIGLGLMDFPGKRRLIRSLSGQHRVLGATNKLRTRMNRDPLLSPN